MTRGHEGVFGSLNKFFPYRLFYKNFDAQHKEYFFFFNF